VRCKKAFIVSIVLLGGLASIASATDYYVRPDGGSYGSEDGSDWSNAFDGFSDVVWGSSAGQVGAGDTLYVAGGNYTSSINPAASGTSDSVRIVIRRATVAEHGTGTGWNSSFDAQVNLQPGAYVRIYGQSYITVDGVTEYGIHVDSPTPTNAYGIYVNNADYVTVQYIKTDGTNNGNDFRGMYWMNSSNTKVRHCHFNDCPNDALLMISIADSVIEYCILGPRITSSGGYHADGIEIRTTENIAFRYNQFNFQGDQVHFGIDGVTDGWDIHGNVFRGAYGSGVAIKTNSDNLSVTNISIYNNVFYNLYRSITSQSNTSGTAKNNILYNVQKVTYDFGTYSHDYNYFKDGTGDEEPPAEAHSVIGGDPFADSANLDFHLDPQSTAIDAGTNLDLTYSTDPDGNTRGQGGGWDIGVYEYPEMLAGDLNRDGAVNLEDLKILTNDWLISEFVMTGLVSYYKFEGNAADSVGGNNGIEVGNPTYTAGRQGQAISLDGDGDYVNCGNDASFNITSAITISAWFKGTFDVSLERIIEKGYNWMLCSGYGDNAAFYCLGFGILEGSATVNDNQWHHAAGVFDGSKMYLYVDGDVDAVMAASGSLNVSTANVYIGGNTSQSFNGLVDDVRIYNRALLGNEVRTLYGGPATDLFNDFNIDFRDFAKLANHWLEDARQP